MTLQEYVYLFAAGAFTKIGCSINPEQRLRHILKSAHPDLPCEPTISHTIPVSNARRAEAALHRYFQSKRVDGEWFTLSEEDNTWLRDQNDASLLELADHFEIGAYAELKSSPRIGSLRKRVTITVRVDEEFLSELQAIARMDYRTVGNEAEMILRWAAPFFRKHLESGEPLTY